VNTKKSDVTEYELNVKKQAEEELRSAGGYSAHPEPSRI
jgi:hypothetical protein